MPELARPQLPPVLETLKTVFGDGSKLPMLPEAAQRALAVAQNRHRSLLDFAAVVKTDPALAAVILRVANSPLFRIGREVDSLDLAVIRLGLRECQNLLITVGMRSMFRSRAGVGRAQCEVLWQHSFLTACLCRSLNRAFELGHHGEEFSGGLSHDLGRILLAVGAPEHFRRADPLGFNEGPQTLAHEQAILGTDHCFLGGWFATRNGLPPSLLAAIEHHHNPAAAGEHRTLVELVAAGDHMANHVQRHATSQGYAAADNAAWCRLTADWDPDTQARAAELIPALMDDASQEAQQVFTFCSL